jgi:iron-sulfur cluster assembly accessory protein
MSVATAEPQELNLANRQPAPQPEETSIIVTEKASDAVKNILNDQRRKCLSELAPDFVEVYNTFLTKEGHAPDFDELAVAGGTTSPEFLLKLGIAAFGKSEHMPQDYRDLYREVASAANGTAPTVADLAARAGVSESEMLTKIGKSAGTILNKVHLRLRTVGAGCSGMTDKLDLDPGFDEKRDVLFTFHGVPVVVDKRSLLYVAGVTVDYHNELNRSGFSISNPNRKSTCGCGSSYSM